MTSNHSPAERRAALQREAGRQRARLAHDLAPWADRLGHADRAASTLRRAWPAAVLGVLPLVVGLVRRPRVWVARGLLAWGLWQRSRSLRTMVGLALRGRR